MKNLYLLFLLLSSWIVPDFLMGQGLINITEVQLTFLPIDGGDSISFSAIDADGDGPNDFAIPDGVVDLMESTTYELLIQINGATNDIDLTDSISASRERYQFFFEFDEGLFGEPNGMGNLSSIGDVRYEDIDSNELPVGLRSIWSTSCFDFSAPGDFRIALVDFGDSKTDTSTVNGGAEIFDLTFSLAVVDDPQAPPCENEEEIITDVVLTWTPVDGGDAITASAQDPDGEGPLDLVVQGDVNLQESTEYSLAITLANSIEGEDITEEIMEEDDEHQFFFSFSENLFDSPDGDGNIDNAGDPVNYNDMDDNGLPVGLSTSWTSACVEADVAGTFRIVLKHQPDEKSATSNAETGGTDVDITWNVNIIEDAQAPPCENEEEIITDVVLTWTPVDGGDAITASAQDPDGEGPLDLVVQGDVNLQESTEYSLAITLTNSIEGEDITEEIMEEDDEHQFFFSFSENLFDSPDGDGNIDNAGDPVNYNDMDDNGLPVGLSTSWTSACVEADVAGTFRIVLKHQPDEKSATSNAETGGTDVDITWNVNIIEDAQAPPCENEEEIITDVVLTWTPVDGGDAITASAQDPDGEGPLDLVVQGDVNLQESTEYSLAITLANSIEGEDITEEIEEEADEHQFFFAWTDDLFSNPEGDGNIDNRDDAVNYNDFDDNNLPVGLSTSWTTAPSMSGGTFRVVLKHQPDEKSATSTAETGGTDLDIEFTINLDDLSSSHPLNDDYDLSVFPNPVMDQLIVDIPAPIRSQDLRLTVTNLAGQVLATQQIARSAESEYVDVSHLQEGIYLLLLQSADGQLIQREKLVKLSR